MTDRTDPPPDVLTRRDSFPFGADPDAPPPADDLGPIPTQPPYPAGTADGGDE